MRPRAPAPLVRPALHERENVGRSVVGHLALLSGPGVLLTAAVAGAAVHIALAWPWGPALLFGTIIAATDPRAVLGLLRQRGTPPRLIAIVEGENLFNDGTALVLFGALTTVLT